MLYVPHVSQLMAWSANPYNCGKLVVLPSYLLLLCVAVPACLFASGLQDNVALIAVLEMMAPDPERSSKQLICVANTHIHANPELNDVKLWQVHTLLKGLEKIANRCVWAQGLVQRRPPLQVFLSLQRVQLQQEGCLCVPRCAGAWQMFATAAISWCTL